MLYWKTHLFSWQTKSFDAIKQFSWSKTFDYCNIFLVSDKHWSDELVYPKKSIDSTKWVSQRTVKKITLNTYFFLV